MIEDDEDFSSLLSSFLSQYNIKVTSYADPYLGLSVNMTKYDLLILDLSLPGMDGLEVCKEIRAKHEIPIIISSARSDITDKIMGLELGADDYLPKPYDPKEMLARINSLLRRYKNTTEPNEPIYRLKIDDERDAVMFDGAWLDLTPAENELLRLLIQNRGMIVSKEQILYENDTFANSSDGSLAVIIGRLRAKLDCSIIIKTVRGIGYKLML